MRPDVSYFSRFGLRLTKNLLIFFFFFLCVETDCEDCKIKAILLPRTHVRTYIGPTNSLFFYALWLQALCMHVLETCRNSLHVLALLIN
jgi:hypothetical protein